MTSRIKRGATLVATFVVLLGLGLALTDRRADAADPPKALVLYDHQPSQAFGKLGHIYAIMLRNLLGHFTTDVVLKPVDQYTAGEVDANDATFYLGSYYDNAVPAAFLSDVKQAQKTVVWFKYNLWKLAWDGTPDFTDRYGIAFDGLVGLNAAPTPTAPEPGFYDTVVYKSRSFFKYYRYTPDDGSVFADPDAGVTRVVDATKAQMWVPVNNSKTGQQIPYVMRSGNFWYVADMPFSYLGPRDRYLVFSDVLHDMLGSTAVAPPRGLVRLEDVSALTSSTWMRQLTDDMRRRGIPFSIALIPFYRDPLGIFNGGVPQEIHLADADAADLRTGLTYALARGGKILMHGYTHQLNAQANPYRAISGEDFEFWDIVNMQPVDGGSPQWTLDRLDAGLAELTGSGYTPFAWEVPHYHASATASRTFSQRFNTMYHRMAYYTADIPDLNPNNPTRDIWAGQFFPYIIQQDYYGQRIIPENLGNIEYDISAIDPTSNVVYTWQDLLTNADYALVVRDGFGSFFFHPFWLDTSLGTPGRRDFRSLVDGMKNLGYIWTDASAL